MNIKHLIFCLLVINLCSANNEIIDQLPKNNERSAVIRVLEYLKEWAIRERKAELERRLDANKTALMIFGCLAGWEETQARAGIERAQGLEKVYDRFVTYRLPSSNSTIYYLPR